MAAIDYKQKIKDYMNSSEVDTLYKSMLNNLFPELKESEDERIRKVLRERIIRYDPNNEILIKEEGISQKQFLSWIEKQGETFTKKDVDDAYLKGVCDTKQELEKQGGQKSIDDLTQQEAMDIAVAKCFEQGEQKPTDTVEPKFHEGEWVFIEEVKGYKNGPFQIKTVDSFGYSFDEYHTIPFMYEELLSKWTIQDAKDGGVLVSNRSIFIFSQEYMAGKPKAHCGIMNGLFIVKPEGCWTNEKCYPATKEQHDLLFQKMKEAGYEWDADKKELKKIEYKPANKKGMNLVEEEMTPFQKEVFCIIDTTIEKELGLKQVCDKLFALASNEIKQNFSWSEDELKVLNEIIEDYEKANKSFSGYQARIDWLKSLKDRYTWKPSDEQMDALHYVTNFDYGGHKATLVSLYEQLKKLKT